MINRQRVQRIRELIYALIVLVISIPIILVIVLSIHLIDLLAEMKDFYLVQNPPEVSQSQSETIQPSNDGYMIEPDLQPFDSGGYSITPEDNG